METGWFSAECHFQLLPGDVQFESGAVWKDRPSMYEVRVTVWEATSEDEAALMAEAEADRYASEDRLGCVRLDSVVVYDMEGPPISGSEVWSQTRHTSMSPDDYLKRYVEEGEPPEDLSIKLQLPE